MKKKHPHLFPLIYGAALVSFTTYALLDVFVIPRSMVSVTQTAGIYASVSPQTAEEAVETDPANAVSEGSADDTVSAGTETAENADDDAALAAGGSAAGDAVSEDAADEAEDTAHQKISSRGKGGNSRSMIQKHSSSKSFPGSSSSKNSSSDSSRKKSGSSESSSKSSGSSSVNEGSSGTEDPAAGSAAAGSSTGSSAGSSTGSSATGSSSTESSTVSSTASAATGSASTEAAIAAAGGTVLKTFADENVDVVLYSCRVDDTTVYVADVDLSNISLLKTAFAQSSYGKNVTAKTSEIASSVGALLAINGDYYGAQERGYVIRNGVLYRSTMKSASQEDLVIYEDGSFEIIREGDISAEELLANGAVQVLSFGPGLIDEGSIIVDENDEVGKAMASNPRTAIGILENGHYIFVVADGRTDESEGLDLLDLAEFMESLGCVTAYNLDGGGSSTMVFAGELINNPTTTGNNSKERAVSDIIYIG